MTPVRSVRSVLGDSREAEIHPGDGHPWITCPFCGSAVYLAEPHPDHQKLVSVARDGRCGNPWCLANPAMPLDAARQARGQAHLDEMAEAARRGNHESAMARLREDRKTSQAAWDKIRAKAVEVDACIPCAWHAFDRQGGKCRLVKHRGPCPRGRKA